MKIILGILIGVLLTFMFLFLYPKFSSTISQNNTTVVNDTSKTKTTPNDLKSENNNIVEKISSVNRRFDDLLIFGGIIITLLLAINVSVYVKAENEVDKHFKIHFDQYVKKIKEDADSVKLLLNQVKANAETTQQLRRRMVSEQTQQI